MSEQQRLRRPVPRGRRSTIDGSVGDAYDNAMCESFFSTLECELLARRKFASQAEAKIACFSYIEGFYNPVRLHSALEYQSPSRYEQQVAKKLAVTQ